MLKCIIQNMGIFNTYITYEFTVQKIVILLTCYHITAEFRTLKQTPLNKIKALK